MTKQIEERYNMARRLGFSVLCSVGHGRHEYCRITGAEFDAHVDAVIEQEIKNTPVFSQDMLEKRKKHADRFFSSLDPVNYPSQEEIRRLANEYFVSHKDELAADGIEWEYK